MQDIYDKIQADPRFAALQSRRQRFSWTLSILILVAYFSFILIIAFKPSLFAIPLGPDTVITYGIPAGLGIIIFSFMLTGIYVWRANGEFDRETQAIVDAASGNDSATTDNANSQ